MMYLKAIGTLLIIIAGVGYLGVGSYSDKLRYVEIMSESVADDSKISNEVFGPETPEYHQVGDMTLDQVVQIFNDRLLQAPRTQVVGLARHFMRLCEKFELDPAFVLSLIHVESSFRARAVSPKGALGLMQVMPRTGKYVANKIGLPLRNSQQILDPYTNLTLGISYLASLRDRFRGIKSHILAAYNVGPTKIDRLLKLKTFRPVKTKSYINKVRQWTPEMRTYGKDRNKTTQRKQRRKVIVGKSV